MCQPFIWDLDLRRPLTLPCASDWDNQALLLEDLAFSTRRKTEKRQVTMRHQRTLLQKWFVLPSLEI